MELPAAPARARASFGRGSNDAGNRSGKELQYNRAAAARAKRRSEGGSGGRSGCFRGRGRGGVDAQRRAVVEGEARDRVAQLWGARRRPLGIETDSGENGSAAEE
eukprot:735019-Rhodomonas_salina.1